MLLGRESRGRCEGVGVHGIRLSWRPVGDRISSFSSPHSQCLVPICPQTTAKLSHHFAR